LEKGKRLIPRTGVDRKRPEYKRCNKVQQKGESVTVSGFEKIVNKGKKGRDRSRKQTSEGKRGIWKPCEVLLCGVPLNSGGKKGGIT